MPDPFVWNQEKPVSGDGTDGKCDGRLLERIAKQEISDNSGRSTLAISESNRKKWHLSTSVLSRYPTMGLDDICDLPVEAIAGDPAHLYLWGSKRTTPRWAESHGTLGLQIQKQHNLVQSPAKMAGPDRRGVGFYFRNVTEVLLFGVRGKNARTLQPGRSQENIISTRKREHSRKPDETV